MATKRHIYFSRVALRLALAAGAAASISGCSDATRLASDPFSDPFGSQTKVASRSGRPIDNVSTGSISGPNTPGPVQSQPLAPPSASASAAPGAGGYDHWSPQGGTPVTVAEGETPDMVVRAVSHGRVSSTPTTISALRSKRCLVASGYYIRGELESVRLSQPAGIQIVARLNSAGGRGWFASAVLSNRERTLR